MLSATAPVRICDIGGWTDTWFGGPGRVVHVAVSPGVEVVVERRAGRGAVVLDVPALGHRYMVVPGETDRRSRHGLLEAAVDAVPPPTDLALDITVRSPIPPGCGVGTSAAVAVALLGALHAVHLESPSPRVVAYEAHRLEVGDLGQESGIQDQVAAAFGGINFIEVDDYPEAAVHRLPDWPELAALCSLVYLGAAHDSSAVHRQVIDDAGRRGPEMFAALREAALSARSAVETQDPAALGRAMVANTAAQRALHPALVGPDAERVLADAAEHGALGAKVNGAGGKGGSVTVLHPTPAARARFVDHLTTTPYRAIPVELSSQGLHIDGAL